MSSIDLNNVPPHHRYSVSLEREETEAERNVRLAKDLGVYLLAAVFVSAIYYLAFITATSATATPEEKKWCCQRALLVWSAIWSASETGRCPRFPNHT